MNQKKSLSIVTSLYYSGKHIEEFYNRSKKIAESITTEVEWIFIDDGSQDDSEILIKKLIKSDSRICYVKLSRNHGHHRALMVGLSYSTKELVFLTDIDLEEEPENLRYFIKVFDSANVEMVYATQIERKGGLFERLSGHIFYLLSKYLSDIKIPKNVVTSRLMTRKFVENILHFKERGIFIAGLAVLTGFKTKEIKINKKKSGETTYTTFKRWNLFIDFLTSFSSKPLHLFFHLSLIIVLLIIIITIFIVYLKFAGFTTLTGWTTLILVSILMGGLNILATGINSLYISKIFEEVKMRPYYIAEEELNVNVRKNI